MEKMKKYLVLIGMFLSNPAFALGQIIPYEALQSTLFGSIQRVDNCGDWQDGKTQGHFRLILAYYAGQDMLFADVVALNEQWSALEVQQGFSFAEINNDHAAISLDNVTCSLHSDTAIKIEGEAVNGHNDASYYFSILVDRESQTYRYLDTHKS
uniref:hypothetical protein n=1 Tax=Thaumasiovibrio occultus TaxID=1891184 RepID=UPI000B35F35D|nr:hypothetical protein [Thaumasiovibrio occultus]